MPLAFEEGIVRFEGHCLVEEALALVDCFKTSPLPIVHLDRCLSMHAALLQVLASARPEIATLPEGRALAAVVQRIVGEVAR
ncbi:MAG: hypothetical protein P4L98_10745 [Ancalomicrobiaceae bacterium]|nr:hypothetical protein [Ancalomicrobiaceae bacterium]